MQNEQPRPLAVITGASTGIGYELAVCCARDGYDLVISADEPEIEERARQLSALSTSVSFVQSDLATLEGVDELLQAVGDRPIAALLANAGRGLGKSFFEQDFDDIRRVIDTNVTGTTYLLRKVGRSMRDHGTGRILVTGSIAGLMPGAYQAVYNATKAFLDSLAFGIRAELADTDVTVTCLMPGPTETAFFERADLQDTKFGQMKKDDATKVAEQGFRAMQEGKADVVTGWQNKLQAAVARLIPAEVTAKFHSKLAEPGSAAR